MISRWSSKQCSSTAHYSCHVLFFDSDTEMSCAPDADGQADSAEHLKNLIWVSFHIEEEVHMCTNFNKNFRKPSVLY